MLGANTVSEHAYTLDGEGDRTALDETVFGPSPAGPEHFDLTYDGLRRLTAVDALVGSEGFSHDGASNLTSRRGPSATYSYDGADRLTSDGLQNFTWSDADRLVQRGSDAFTYDPLDRLTGSTVGLISRTYTYDGDGLLASRSDLLGSASFLWDVSAIPAPLLEVGPDRIVHGLGPLYAARAYGSTVTFARDALGSVRAEVTDLGLVSGAFRYRAYGELSQATGSGPSYLGYAGELPDPSGLIYLRARWYDPATGRFLTHDPVSGSHDQPVTLNAYLYAHANPVMNTDPSWKCPICVTLILGAIELGGLVPAPDYAKLQVGAENPLGVHSTYVLDREGNLYVQPVGVAAGTPGAFASATVGWLVQEERPTPDELRSFNEGPAILGGGAAGLAVDLAWSPEAKGRTQYALEVGVGTPRAGLSGGYAFWATQFALRW